MSIVTELKYTANLDKGVCMTPITPSFMGGDQEAHRIIVDCYRQNSREAVDLASAGVTAYFVRADGMTIPLNGETEGNKASVLLPAACYAVMGRFSLVIKLSLGDSINTVFWGEGAVSRSRTDVVIDPDSVIPSLDELLAQIDAMEQATAAAQNVVGEYDSKVAEQDGKISQLTEEIDAITVKKTGKNIFFSEWSESGKGISSAIFGGDVDDALAGRRRTGYVKVEPNKIYTLNTSFGVAPNVYVYFYKQAEATEQSYISYIKTDYGFYPKTITTPAECGYIRILHTTENTSDDRLPTDYQVEEGEVATNYEEPYSETLVPYSKIADLPEETLSYKGKNYLFLGDSITAMEGSASWVEKFKSMVENGNKTNVQAVGGATWCDKTSGLVYNGEPYNSMNHIGNQVAWCQAIGFASDRFDFIFISAGTNDTNLSFPTDDEIELEMYSENTIKPLNNVDRSTWAGAIRWTVQNLREMYPNAKIILVTPLQRCVDFDETTLKDMYPIIRQKRDTIIKMAKRMGAYYIDTAECDITNFDTTDFADNLHPSSKGAEKLANYIFKKALPIICE